MRTRMADCHATTRSCYGSNGSKRSANKDHHFSPLALAPAPLPFPLADCFSGVGHPSSEGCRFCAWSCPSMLMEHAVCLPCAVPLRSGSSPWASGCSQAALTSSAHRSQSSCLSRAAIWRSSQMFGWVPCSCIRTCAAAHSLQHGMLLSWWCACKCRQSPCKDRQHGTHNDVVLNATLCAPCTWTPVHAGVPSLPVRSQ